MYKPKSKRTSKQLGPVNKKTLNGLTANKNIDDIIALSKISNTQTTEIKSVNSGLSKVSASVSSKQNKLSLTTTGSSGPATLSNDVLNIPQYGGGGGSAVWGGITGTLSAQTDLQSALNSKENTITPGTTSQYWRGDKTWQVFPTIPTVTPSALTKTDDTNVTITLGGSPSNALLQAVSLVVGWTGTLADSRIASAATWNAKQNAITLTTTGTSGPATLVGATLNIPQYSGGGGGASIIKISAQTLLSASWSLSGGYYVYTFSNVNITTNTRVDFTPDNSAYTEVTTCGMLPQVDVAAGTCRFFSLFPPQSDILGEVTIIPTV
jgi:hypothetical protein